MQDDDSSETGGEGDSADGRQTPESAAAYIAAMTFELARMARRNGLDTLGCLLDMAHVEANRLATDE